MENKGNTIFYNVLTTLSHDKKYTQFQKTKQEFVRFLIRISDDKINDLQDVFDIEPCKKKSKTTQGDTRDKTLENDFTFPYDNTQGADMNSNHCNIVSNEEYIDEIKDLLTAKFGEDVCFRRKKQTITTKINITKAIRGTWETVNQDFNTNKYPICILSYDRHDKNGKTHLYLTKCKIKHFLFVEPSEYDEYMKWINMEYCVVIKCPEDFHLIGMGSTTVRNYILKWGRNNGFERVWVLDDNIKDYKRLHQGIKNDINSHEIFTSVEDYIDRYDNVGIVSHNFNPFISEGDCRSCIVKNGKCYSSMLIPTNKDIKFRYKHQEDNLISMEYIHKGYTTLCFNHILYNKDTSGENKGGNNSIIYKVDEKTKDGDGYKERFEYFERIIWILNTEKRINLREGSTINDLLKRDYRMGSKEYHGIIYYKHLVGRDNKITKKVNYDQIVSSQKQSSLKLVHK